ncbi:hypothetical protein DITRI_Ditri20bG0046200 [Diplodiscus trichospermus]
MEIKLAIHEHPMAYHDLHGTDHQWCDKCREKIFSAAYACLRCELWLHKSCAKALEHLPHEITHPLHPQHRLILDWTGSIGRKFITCRKCLKISSGTRYACCRCDFKLDLVCAFATDDHQTMKKKERSNSDKNKKIIQHDCHLHPLILCNYGNTEEHDRNCSWCDKPLTGICYGCNSCDFMLHEDIEASVEKDSSSAAQSMDLIMKGTMEQVGINDNIQNPQQLLVRPLTHQHPLKFYEASEKLEVEEPYCRACRSELSGPGYFCEGCPHYYLHENCAKLPNEMQHPLHPQHPLNLCARSPYMFDFVTATSVKIFLLASLIYVRSVVSSLI